MVDGSGFGWSSEKFIPIVEKDSRDVIIISRRSFHTPIVSMREWERNGDGRTMRNPDASSSKVLHTFSAVFLIRTLDTNSKYECCC